MSNLSHRLKQQQKPKNYNTKTLSKYQTVPSHQTIKNTDSFQVKSLSGIKLISKRSTNYKTKKGYITRIFIQKKLVSTCTETHLHMYKSRIHLIYTHLTTPHSILKQIEMKNFTQKVLLTWLNVRMIVKYSQGQRNVVMVKQ